MHRKNLVVLFRILVVCVFVMPLSALSAGVSPYLPLNLPQHINQKIEKLAVITRQATLHKPYKVAQVTAMARSVQNTHPMLYRELLPYLTGHRHPVGVSLQQVSVSSSNGNSDRQYQFGVNDNHSASFELAGYAMYSDHVGLSGSTVFTDKNAYLAQAMFHAGVDWAQVDVGYKSRWWSVGRIHSTLLSNQSEAFASVSLSNVTPLSLFNIHYEAFAGKLNEQSQIVTGAMTEIDQPMMAGLMVSVNPIKQLTLGVAQTTMFGGAVRENDTSAFVNALINDEINSAVEGGYQDAQADRRYAFQVRFNSSVADLPYSLYSEVVTKDTLGSDMPTARAFTAGIYFPLLGNHALRVEGVNWERGFYTSAIYASGYQDGVNSLGHALAPNAQSSAATSVATEWFWSMSADSSLTTKVTWSEIDRYNNEMQDDVVSGAGVAVDYRSTWRNAYWGITASTGLDNVGERVNRLTLYLGF